MYIIREETWKRKWFSLLAAENNPIRTNYVKTKIDNTWKTIKCSLYGDRDKKS